MQHMADLVFEINKQRANRFLSSNHVFKIYFLSLESNVNEADRAGSGCFRAEANMNTAQRNPAAAVFNKI